MQILVSIVICTYNRSRLLKKCLDSLLPQLLEEIEIIVIDNNSTDETANITKEYLSSYKNIRYVFEKNTGLSYARNRGIEESKSDWILYLDDDAIAFPNLVNQAIYLVKRGDFDCVGGVYYAYAEGEKPKWYDISIHNYKGNHLKLESCQYNIPIGCVVLYNKKCLIEVGLFKLNLGMKGEKVGYSEETELQKSLFEAGMKIGIDPSLKIWHLINENKMTLNWQITSFFAEGRDNIYKYSSIEIIFNVFKSFGSSLFKALPKNVYKLIISKNYFWQNFILDTLKPAIRGMGLFYGKFIA